MMMARKKYVDYIKAIGITLVILGHINYANDVIKEWIYAFHMPLFFFASGLVIKREDISRNFVLKKFQSLIVPYFIWGFIYSGDSISNVAHILYGSYYTISEAGSLTSLWFLPTMFLAVILTQIILKVSEKLWIIGIIAAILFLISTFIPQIKMGYPWCIDVSLLAAAFILLGYLFEKVVGRISNLGGWILLCIVGFVLTLTYKLNPIVSASYVLMASMRIGNLVIFLLSALGGCLMVYSASKVLECFPIQKKLISFIGINTLVIFAVQKPLITVFGKCFNIVSMPWFIELTVTGLGTLVCSCILCLFVNRFAPCLAGKPPVLYSKSITEGKLNGTLDRI